MSYRSLEETKYGISTLSEQQFELLIDCIASYLVTNCEAVDAISVRDVEYSGAHYVTLWLFHHYGPGYIESNIMNSKGIVRIIKE